jgi:hypothetical protein
MADQITDPIPTPILDFKAPKVSGESSKITGRLNPNEPQQTFDEFKNSIVNLGTPDIKVPPIPGIGSNPGGDGKPKLTALQQALLAANATPDSTKYTYDASELSDRYKKVLPDVNNEYVHHEGQSSMDRIGNAAVNLVAKTGGFLTQTAGFIVGAPAALATWNISNLTDNFLVKAGDAINKGIEDTNPIYKGKQYTEGNIWQKLSTTDWWLSDAVDRTALTIATIVPGFAEAKGLGLFGSLATDVAETGSAARATGVGAKLIESAMTNPQEFGTMGKLFSRGLYSAAAKFGATGDAAVSGWLKTMTGAELFGMGVVGQSGLNAKEAQESVKQSLIDQRVQGLNDFTDQQIEERASQAAVKGFWYTAPLSFINEALELPMLFSSVRNAKGSLLNKVFNPQTGEVLADALAKQTPAWYKVAFKAAYTGLEHGQNESMQVAIGRTLEEEYGARKDARGRILPGTGLEYTGEGNSILQNFIDNVNDPNGQNNIALGTIQGMLTALVGFGKDIKTDRYGKELTQRKSVHDQILQAKLDRRYYETDFAQRDGNGKMIVDAKGNVQFDQQKLADAGLSLAGVQKDIQYMYNAMQNEDYTEVQRLQDKSLAGFAYNFLNDSNGIIHLNNLLKIKSEELSKDPSRINDISTSGTEITPAMMYQKQLDKVQEFKKIFHSVDSERITLSDLGEYDKKYDVQKRNYLEALKFTKYANTAQQMFLKEKIAENILDATALGVTEITDVKNDAQQIKGNSLLKENVKLQTLLDVYRDRYSTLSNIDEVKSGFEEYLKKNSDYVKGPVDATPPAATDAKTVTIKTKQGDVVVKAGTKYIAGGKEVNTIEGVTIPKFMEFTLVGEDEKGNVIIKTDDNKVHSITKEAFEDYKLSDTDKLTPNVRVFIDNADKKFNYQLKGGKSIEGRLEFNKKTGGLEFHSLELKKDGKTPKRIIPITRDQLIAKEGYFRAQVYSDSKFTPETEALLKEKQTEEEKKLAANLDAKMTERRRIVKEVYDDTKAELERISDKILKKKEALDKINAEMSELAEFRQKSKYDNTSIVVAFNKIFSRSMKGLSRLSGLKTSLENELFNLQSHKDDLEFNISYFEDLLQNVQELPEKLSDLLADLKSDISGLETLSLKTGEQINQFSKLIDSTNAAIKDLTSLLQSTIEKFDKDYPDYIRASFERILSEEGNPPAEIKFILEYSADLALMDDIRKEININKNKIKDFTDKIDDLNNQLNEIGKVQNIKEEVLKTFEKAVNEELARKKADEELKKNAKLMKEFLGTNSNDVQANIDEDIDPTKRYQPESKKNKLAVVGGTIPIDTGRDHQKRANTFGYNFNTFDNKDDIHGLIITSKTEDLIGLGKVGDASGLTEHLVLGSNASASDVIALVMVQSNADGTYTLVDENGKPIEGNNDLVNKAIYQVFPSDKLELTYNGKLQTMFREKDLEFKDSFSEQYKQWRTEELNRTTLGDVQGIASAFGIPEYIQKTVIENGTEKSVRDDDGRSSAEEAGLITKDMLIEDRVIEVATNNDFVSNGSVTFRTPLGRVFLKVPGGLVKLFSTKFSAQKANVIYDVMLELAKTAKSEDGIKGEKATKLFNWLRSTVYWGITKDFQTGERKQAGYNNIWFEDVSENGETYSKLFISGKGEGFAFTESDLEANKESIITVLQGMYHNTNATMVNGESYRNPYYEITGIGKDGEPVVKKWENYQSYLLSSEGRKLEDIPLKTKLRPISKENPTNRKGIYFTLTNTVDRFTLNKPAPVVTTTPSTPAKQAPVQQQAPKQVPGTYVLDGNADNTIKIGNLGTTTFKLDGKLYNETNGQKGFTPTFDGALVDSVMKTLGIDEEAAQAQIAGAIIQAMTPQLEAMKIPDTAPIEPLTDKDEDDWNNFPSAPIDNKAYRLQITNNLGTITPENWEKVEEFMSRALKNIPVYRTKNLIDALNGQQAWGMYKNGAIYIYENAEIGTVYHEVFHAVWRAFASAEERKAVENEFRNRKGSYKDILGKEIKYSEATQEQFEERLAEEFRNFVQFNEAPPKGSEAKSWIGKMFEDLVNYIKRVFTRNAQTSQQIFNKINTGKYNKYIPFETGLSYAKKGIQDVESVSGEGGVFKIAEIPPTQVHEIMQQMTYKMLTDLTNDNKSLFNITKSKENRSEIYEKLKNDIKGNLKAIGDTIAQEILAGKKVEEDLSSIKFLFKQVNNNWDKIVEKYESEYLKQYGIEFDENHELILNDENKSGKSDWQDARKIDVFKRANSAIKILIATIARTIPSTTGPVRKLSSIGGSILVPSDKVNITLLNKLSDSTGLEDMFDKLRDLAINDQDYIALYQRLTKGSITDNNVDFTKLKDEHDLQLIGAFWNAYKKNAPDVRNVFILSSGEVVVGDANLSRAATQFRADMFNNLIGNIKTSNPYVEYDAVNKVYTAKDAINKKDLLNPSDLRSYVNFLNTLGITFTLNDIEKLKSQRNNFIEAVNGVRKSIASIKDVKTLNKKTINLEGRLLELGTIKAILENPDFESTYFNISGERVQTYIGTNPMSDLYHSISELKNISEIINTPFKYLLSDSFSKGSVVLRSIFNIGKDAGTGDSEYFNETGKRKKGTEEILHTGYAGGIIDESTGKRKEASKVTYKERLIQELNMNHEGYYMNLIPADASIEHMTRLHTREVPFVSDESLSYGYDDVNDIFKNYFKSEVELAREDRPIVKIKLTEEDKKAGKKQRESGDLRFFKGILGEQIHAEITSEKNKDKTPEELYNVYVKEINSAVKKFIESETKDLREILNQYDIISYGEEGLQVEGLHFSDEKDLSNDTINKYLKTLSVNYIIANIEFHKLIYADPYQYSDELKRIKLFNSPRQSLISGSRSINESFDKVYNKGLKLGDIGYKDLIRDYFKTVTLKDIFAKGNLLGYEEAFEKTDGAGYITLGALRTFRLHAGDWLETHESQYQHDIAYEKLVKSGATEEQIKEFDKKNPEIISTYTPIKPVTAGNKQNGQNYNDVVLDKFALFPLSFRVLHKMGAESNALKLYNKMNDEDIDYAVYSTGRKIGGSTGQHSLYKGDQFNNDDFDNIINVPYSIIGVQSEVPSKTITKVTTGSQITKMATMDFMEAGMPIDFEPGPDINARYAKWITLPESEKLKSTLYKEIVENQKLLEARIKDGMNNLLKKLDITKTSKGYVIGDINKMTKTLTDEIFKRDINDNVKDAFEGFKTKQVVLEATPAYQQIRNILYSIADKTVISPKINGKQLVQSPDALLEKDIKVENINGKDVYTSNLLKFYVDKDGQRVCEIAISRWFKSNLSDEELLEYLNTTDEGKKILSGIAYRIPTQKQNSIDVFKIGKFLPKELSDSVVVPSELVKKSGSDFDIDKLSVYMKNVYIDKDGFPKLVPFFGREEVAAKEEIKKFLLEEDMKALLSGDEEVATDNIEDDYDTIADKLYSKSLENAYIQSLENLISHPLNFASLIQPNDADQLKKLSKKITDALGEQQFDYSSVNNMLNRKFMSTLRQDFISGKYIIGIAATAQTNNVQNQRSTIYIDLDRLKKEIIDPIDEKWLGDGQINLPHNRLVINGKERATLSLPKNTAGQYISDIIGQFIDGYVDISKGPWIMQLGARGNIASTWLFLTKIGVPIDTVAYFMNQPIVKSYLNSIEKSGYSYLFMDSFVNNTLDVFSPQVRNIEQSEKFQSISEVSFKELKEMIGKTPDKLTDVQLNQQQFILNEFLKYAKMSEHLFKVQQGSNFDTATFNDPYIVFKKKMQLEEARKTIISSVDDLLEASHINFLKNTIYDVRDMFADTMLMSDRANIRNIMEAVLKDYINTNDRDFTKLAQKSVNTLFDWAVQVDRKLNTSIQEILLGTDTNKSAADQIIDFQQKVLRDPKHALYDNLIIRSIKKTPGGKENTPNNLSISGRDNKVYNQNQIIYAFNQLRDSLTGEDKGLYSKLVRLAVIQSGLTNSPIAFTNLLPYQDFSEVYNKSLSKLEKMPNLADFYKLNVIERNNWADTDIVPFKKASWFKNKKGKWMYDINRDRRFIEPALNTAMNQEKIPDLVKMSPFSREGRADFLTYSWEDRISAKAKAERKAKGDTSYIHKGLYKKVYNSDGTPMILTSESNGKTYTNYVYKAINAWGDSFRANEFYDKMFSGQTDSTIGQKSVIDNGYEKVNEVEDRDIENILNAANTKNINPVTKQISTTVKPSVTKIISGGQTGIDRMGLEVGKELGFQTGGVAPKGYRTEKGLDPSLKDYGLTEHSSSQYDFRTAENIKNSDGTVLFGNAESSGSRLTINLAKNNKKPIIVNPTAQQLRNFMNTNSIQVLNVAGNRASGLTNAQISDYRSILKEALSDKKIDKKTEGKDPFTC